VTADAVVWHGHGLSGSYSDDACRELDPPSDLSFFHEKKLSGLAERVLRERETWTIRFVRSRLNRKRLRLEDFTKIPNGTGGVKDRLSIPLRIDSWPAIEVIGEKIEIFDYVQFREPT
jgi:hypothetical protein